MKLALGYPVYPFRINQHFGENIPCVSGFGTPSQRIVDGLDNTTCPIGYTKLYAEWGMAGHNGTDIVAGVQPVYAACDGTVIEQQLVPSRGLGLGIITDTPVELTCGEYYAKIRYWHLQSFTVKIGDHVTRGQQIGVTDSTGYSSGNHLHFELQPMRKDLGGHPILLYPEGSIAGAISAEPYFDGTYANATVKTPSGMVPYEQAMYNLDHSGLPLTILLMAKAILKTVYKR
jgi:murein DD-endopeptidase MepM/ murein hydrolase activator NlpD